MGTSYFPIGVAVESKTKSSEIMPLEERGTGVHPPLESQDLGEPIS
jgi:hypothetical protein